MTRALAAVLVTLAPALYAGEPDWPALEKQALELLQKYVQVQSVNPPADTRAAAALLKGALERNGIEARLFESGPNGQTNLLVRIPGRDRSKKPLMLMNHMDVVPVDRAAWTIDPFAAMIRDGKLWGRGALDMKSIGVEHLMALVALKQAGIVPQRDIVMLSTADEETDGVHGIRWMIANHYSEFDPEYVLDEGGFGTRDILAPGKLVFGISVGEKQTVWLRVRARGTAGHGSQPVPDNANVILMRALAKAMALPPAQPHPVVAEMIRRLGPLAHNRYTDAIQRNTVSLTTLTAGVGSPVKVNVIPSVSEATLDCRLLPGVDKDRFITDMKARINDPRVTVEPINSPVDAGVSDSRTPLFEAIRKAVLALHPDAVVVPMLVPHGTDSVNLRKRGVIAYGLTPMVLDLEGAAMHGDAERVPVDEFLTGIHIVYEVLRNM
jgi:acetylornithine deacetylase/succinyl-diaminopimelate desuccinylase-like protein